MTYESAPATPVIKKDSNTSLMWSALVVATVALIAAAVALYMELSASASPLDTSTELAIAANSDDEDSNEEQDLFSQPDDLSELITRVQESTVTIRCKSSQGSGWVLELGSPPEDADPEALEIDREFPYEVITNHHVIEECVDTPKRVRAQTGDTEYDAYLYSWDEENDLAIVAISQNVPALDVSPKPEPGWWAMAIGTPYGLEGSISIGNVMNTEVSDIIATTPLNSGNSGGPLVNSRGQVMGTNTWVLIEDDAQDWNVAVGTPALCDTVVLCETDDPLLWE